MVAQLPLPNGRQILQPHSLLLNNSLVTALQTLLLQVGYLADQPKILCLGQDSNLLPGLIANPALKALNCWFVFENGTAPTDSGQEASVSLGTPADAIVLMTDERFTLTPARLRHLKRHLKPQGRLIVVAPYRASIVALLQKYLPESVQPAQNRAAAVSVNALFRMFEAEGYGDPYLRLVGGLPGFWESVVCSVTPGT